MSETVAFVCGATGKQGGATARELLKAGVKVHALVRDPSSKSATELQKLGAHLFHGDFDNVSALKTAMEGVTAVFLNVLATLANPDSEVIHAMNVLNAAKETGTVTTIVYSSVVMTGRHEEFPGWGPDYPMKFYWDNKAEIESLVRASGVQNWTILRPPFLMSNYVKPAAAYMYPDLVERRVFLTAYKPDMAMTLLDEYDVGKFAAAAILDPAAYNRHEINLGVEGLTVAEIVRELSRVSGKEISVAFYDEKEVKERAKDIMMVNQLWTNEVGYQVDFKALEKYPIHMTTFAEYLDKNCEVVKQTFN